MRDLKTGQELDQMTAHNDPLFSHGHINHLIWADTRIKPTQSQNDLDDAVVT
jgi:hypothetical protein